MTSPKTPPAGYSGTPLLRKLGLRAGHAAAVSNAPADYKSWLEPLPEGVRLGRRLVPNRDFVHLFSTSASDLRRRLPAAKRALKKTGTLWISWPKKSSGVISDVDENVVRKLGLEAGLVDVKVCAVTSIWSGLKFVYRLKDR